MQLKHVNICGVGEASGNVRRKPPTQAAVSQAVFSKIKEMALSAREDIIIGIDTPFDLHLHGIDEVIHQASKHLETIRIITGKEGIDNPGEVKVLYSLADFAEIRIGKEQVDDPRDGGEFGITKPE